MRQSTYVTRFRSELKQYQLLRSANPVRDIHYSHKIFEKKSNFESTEGILLGEIILTNIA